LHILTSNSKKKRVCRRIGVEFVELLILISKSKLIRGIFGVESVELIY
jgi:hypothetical protein